MARVQLAQLSLLQSPDAAAPPGSLAQAKLKEALSFELRTESSALIKGLCGVAGCDCLRQIHGRFHHCLHLNLSAGAVSQAVSVLVFLFRLFKLRPTVV